ncbi:hypothetical protein [Bradyrhizobium elkanii]
MPNAVYIERGVSALKSDAVLHLGNFFGALRGSLDGQELYARNNFLFIANRHYLVDFDAHIDAEDRNIDLVRDFLAVGFDPKRTVLYRQSDVRELFTLMWLLSCNTPAKELLNRKDFSSFVDPSLANVLYPQLMAADIFGLRATRVFVGPDEEEHLSYCRDVAVGVNERAQAILLPSPNRGGRMRTERLVGLNGQPMSKTAGNTIPLFAADKTINRLFDSIPVARVKKLEPLDPDTDVSFQLIKELVDSAEAEELRSKYLRAEIGGEDARALAKEQFYKYFRTIRSRRIDLQNSISNEEIEEILFNGQQRVRREMRSTFAVLDEHLYNGRGRKSAKPRPT